MSKEEEEQKRAEEEAEAEKERQRFSEIQHVEDFKHDLEELNTQTSNELIAKSASASQVGNEQKAMDEAANELEELMK